MFSCKLPSNLLLTPLVWNFTQWLLIFLYGNTAFIYNVCNGERTVTKILKLCPIVLIYVSKICSIQFNSPHLIDTQRQVLLTYIGTPGISSQRLPATFSCRCFDVLFGTMRQILCLAGDVADSNWTTRHLVCFIVV